MKIALALALACLLALPAIANAGVISEIHRRAVGGLDPSDQNWLRVELAYRDGVDTPVHAIYGVSDQPYGNGFQAQLSHWDLDWQRLFWVSKSPGAFAMREPGWGTALHDLAPELAAGATRLTLMPGAQNGAWIYRTAELGDRSVQLTLIPEPGAVALALWGLSLLGVSCLRLAR